MRPIAVGLVVLVAVAGCAVAAPPPPPPLSPSPSRSPAPHATRSGRPLVTPTASGTSSPAAASSLRLGIISYNLPLFEQRTGIHPVLSAIYLNWGSPYPAAKILSFYRLGVTTLVVLEPREISPQLIAAGQGNAYLASFAAAERELAVPILLSFAPEANGIWYPWGAGHISPAAYQAMYREVHDVLLRDGIARVTWIWQVDRSSRATEALSLLWPGSAYVNAVGIDGQLDSATATFGTVFGPTITQLRSFTSVPVMLSEVGVGKGGSRGEQIASLFAASRQANLSALNLFDVGTWNFDQDGAAIRSIRAAARQS